MKRLCSNRWATGARPTRSRDFTHTTTRAPFSQTLERVGQLLQIGFGAAGAEIIGKNINSGSGRLNAMVPGKKITSIYGFCDIRQFTDTTECLQEEARVNATARLSVRRSPPRLCG